MNKLIEKIVERIKELPNAEADYYFAPSNDVIDREDTIDIIHEESKAYNEFATDTNVGSKGDLISRSELIKAIRKSTCHWPEHLWKQVVCDIIENQPTAYNGGWIPCSKRLPETNKSVLCWAKSTARGGDVCFVGSCHNGFWFLQSSADTHSFPGQYVIVAWHPLPEPYRPCTNTDCVYNSGNECPASEGCAGYETKGGIR